MVGALSFLYRAKTVNVCHDEGNAFSLTGENPILLYPSGDKPFQCGARPAIITRCETAGWGFQMPTKVTVELIIVWACVGFFTGAGWAVATWLVGRILSVI